MSSNTLNFIQIGNSNRASNVVHAEWWRTVNAVGRCMILLRNVDQIYNGVFDVQDTITISVQPPGGVATTMFRGRVDGPAVTLMGQDLESPWEEYVIVRGVDKWQDMLFHNDYDTKYPDPNNEIKDIFEDLFDFPKAIDTNITYTTPVGATPTVGAVEFRKGSSFLTTIQEALRAVDWVSYVDDAGNLRAGSPGFSATAEILTNTGADKNIVGTVEYRERDGDKLYNYVELWGKSPSFDGYTEYYNYDALDPTTWNWLIFPLGNWENNTTTTMVGDYSLRVYNTNPVSVRLQAYLDITTLDYDSADLSKGEIGIWARYDNQAAGTGAPGAGAAAASDHLMCRVVDINGVTATYYGASSLLYRGDWGYCTFPVGEKYQSGTGIVADQWTVPLAGAALDWEQIIRIDFIFPDTGGASYASNLFLDGISLPFPVRAIEEDAASQTAYRRRPLPLPMPHISNYNSMRKLAEEILAHSKDSNIAYLKMMVAGNVNLHYAGQSVTVNIPELGLNNSIFYITELHHVCEPRKDISNGYGFDYLTEVELAPIFGVAYDMSRLGDRQIYSPTQLSMRAGTGLGVK